MQTGIWLYRLYDVAEEIDLNRVEQLLSVTLPTVRLRLAKIRAKSMQLANPPVAVELLEETLYLGPWQVNVQWSAKIFDLGVVSLVMRILMPGEVDLSLWTEMANFLYNSEEVEMHFERQLATVLHSLAPALHKPAASHNMMEDFTVYYFRRWNRDWDPVPLLLAETEKISNQVRRDTLQHSFSYGPDDLTIITWDSALVYDAGGSTDIPDLLELGLAQLLELRYYDDLLSRELAQAYQDIEWAERRLGRLSQYRRIMKRLMELVVDITEIIDRIQNSLKVTEDIFYARVYSAALSIFRTRVWVESIERKTNLLRKTYSMLSEEIVTRRSMTLEVAIVLLFILEIIMGLFGHF